MLENSTDKMLVALVPETIKDDVVDALMGNDVISGFSLYKIQGFSREHSHFNLREQVEGYKSLYRFEVAHQAAETPNILEILAALSDEKIIRYWVLPIEDSGVV